MIDLKAWLWDCGVVIEDEFTINRLKELLVYVYALNGNHLVLLLGRCRNRNTIIPILLEMQVPTAAVSYVGRAGNEGYPDEATFDGSIVPDQTVLITRIGLTLPPNRSDLKLYDNIKWYSHDDFFDSEGNLKNSISWP